MSVRMLLLGVYGMEMVECGGALALNARNGGKSFASIMLAGDRTKRDVSKAAEVLGVEKVYFSDFVSGEVDFDRASKIKLVRIIREVRPDIIITQDPEHCQVDLDPDRRPAMTLLQEPIALAEPYRREGLFEFMELRLSPSRKLYALGNGEFPPLQQKKGAAL